jgi:hypothetical protein
MYYLKRGKKWPKHEGHFVKTPQSKQSPNLVTLEAPKAVTIANQQTCHMYEEAEELKHEASNIRASIC